LAIPPPLAVLGPAVTSPKSAPPASGADGFDDGDSGCDCCGRDPVTAEMLARSRGVRIWHSGWGRDDGDGRKMGAVLMTSPDRMHMTFWS